MNTHNGLRSVEIESLVQSDTSSRPPLRDVYQTAGIDPLTIAPEPSESLGRLYLGAREKYSDGMSLALAVAKEPYEKIELDYIEQESRKDFSDVEFFDAHFVTPEPSEGLEMAAPGVSILDYTESIRPNFIHPSQENGSFDIWLPYNRTVAGAGRFSHQSFLWDGYHIASGYASDGRWDLVRDIVDNTEFEINRYGYGLNGSASFLATRSQPPYFSHEVSMLADEYGDEALVRYLPAMEKEYSKYWMDGQEHLAGMPNDGSAYSHRTLVRVPLANGKTAFLNRYWDDADGPRLESYQEDFELGEMVVHGLEGATRNLRLQKLYKDLRSGAASGWDFSSRWFEDGKSISTINTTDILPVDLNSLLARTEQVLARAHTAAGNPETAKTYQNRHDRRVEAINQLLWDPESEIYRDYNFVKGRQTNIVSAATSYPLYVGISNPDQTFGVAKTIEKDLLFRGGIVATTTDESDQQWDGGTRGGSGNKNVWAPLNWASARGLARIAHMMVAEDAQFDTQHLIDLSEEVRTTFMSGVQIAFEANRTVPEKLNGDNPAMMGKGGEYSTVKVLAMTSEIYRAMHNWDPSDPNGCLPVGGLALKHSLR